MKEIIDFFFDYSSPFGYLASERIEEIAHRHNRTVLWHPILLGAVFKVTGQAPLTQAPLKGDYSIRDFSRSAREQKITYNHPQSFPIGAVAASRATLWVRDNQEPEIAALAADFVHAVFRAYFAQGLNITDPVELGKIGLSIGIDDKKLLHALTEQKIKDALHEEVDNAIKLGIFGSPMMLVDNEPFWGHDRLEQLDRWLGKGGW